ncbi:hypothetical protein [Chelativorans sp. AA-79]|uniref:hypothetical protein n=1 Tax=Chelativorans sp. AA-79 TaxID=3028735 RepID=UPI0023F8FFFC|nr:hypothetical protein [Chelativorans sp. AA-79]WEX08733.1 hypothetical protein PVE73_22130 [Chelativorans sp. AA-79]
MAQGIRIGAGLIALGAAAGLAISIAAYLSRGSGINGTEGALLVIASSAAILVAALALVFKPAMHGLLRGVLLFLLFLGILGTGAAAYFLASIWLQLAMAVCLVGWLAVIIRPRGRAHTVKEGASA